MKLAQSKLIGWYIQMLHDLKKNEHVKYLPEISLDKRFRYVIPRQWDNTAKGVVWSFNPDLARDYESLEFKEEWSWWIQLGICESGWRIGVWQNKWQQGYNVGNDLGCLGLLFKPNL